MPSTRLLPTRLLRTLSLLAALAAAAPLVGQGAPRNLDRTVARVLQTFEVPGLALTIVKDGKVVVAKGYGVKTLGQPDPVDAQTLFGIASNTKVFTATALGLLVERGLLEWDVPVVRYLPWFAMWDPWVTQHITIRDLLVHRSGLGLGAGDLLWWPPSTYDRKEISYRLRYIQPVTSFRSAYAYDNVLYTVAGEVIEAVSGRTWENFVQTEILDRVGMRASNVRHSAAEHGGNVATTHARVDGAVRVVKPFASDNTNPAGGINASAEDMARWLIVQLDSGRIGDEGRLFTERTARQLWTIVVPRDAGVPPPEVAPLRAGFLGYALGLNVRDYRGQKLITHTGGLPGYVSRVAFMPDLKLGVAVLTNMESGAAFDALTWTVLDHYLGAPAFDWIAAYVKLEERAAGAMQAAEAGANTARDTTSHPSLPLERYAATYRDAWYGDIAIRLEDGTLVMQFSKTPSLLGDLEHWQHDTFVVRWRDRELRADAFVTFALNPDGSIREARMEPTSPAVDFSFDFQDLLLKPVKDGRD
jgi:CubicO group peptidase (beta-lactamase class C family)